MILSAASGDAEPKATPTGSIVAGTYSGLMQFTFAAACASIIFGPVGLPLTIGIQHALLAFVAMQVIVTATTSVPGGSVLAVPSFEVLPFLARFALICSTAIGAGGLASGALLATVLAGSMLVTLCASVLLFFASEAPLDKIDQLLPPPLQCGLFAAIGWSLYLLSYDTLGLAVAPLGSLFTMSAMRLWLPANVLGVGLWQASRKTDTPLLFPLFILAVTAVVHAALLATGTSISAARAAGWLMADAVGEPCTALFRAFSPSLVRWDVLLSGAALKQLISAALFGPLVNSILNYVLYGPLIKKKLNLKAELKSHAAATAASAVCGGYSNYMGLSDSAIHRKIGGLDKRSCYIAAGVAALFLLAYPICGLVGYLPTTAIAAILVFVGCDFLYDNLIAATRDNGWRAGLAGASVLAICVRYDMLVGSLTGIIGFQLAGLWQRRRAAAA